MKALLTLIFLLSFGTLVSHSQVTTSTPLPVRAQQEKGGRSSRTSTDPWLSRDIRIGGMRGRPSYRALQIYRTQLNQIYRKPTKSEARAVEPLDADRAKYSDFLRHRNTGIIKLVPDFGCGDNTRVISAAPECRKFTLPGGGSAYSFRSQTYRIKRLSDLAYHNGTFVTPGIMLHGILGNFGDLDIEDITIKSDRLAYVRDFEPVTNIREAASIERGLSDGYLIKGVLYKESLPVVAGATYVLRSIAYRGTSYQVIEGIAYDEFDLDRRRDVTIAFKVIRVHDVGALT